MDPGVDSVEDSAVDSVLDSGMDSGEDSTMRCGVDFHENHGFFSSS